MLLQLKTFTEFISKHSLLDHSATVLLAVSGGKDSVVMTHLFHKAGFKIAIAHCNFNLRAQESVRDENFVRNLALKLNTPFHLANFDTNAYALDNKISTQMAARDLRYNFFEEVLTKHHYQKIATAHHLNDGIETLLLNLIRGTGIAGLHGIKSERGSVIRPMLCFTRSEIDDMVTQNKLDFVEDSSNGSTKYIRNKIRLKIVPEMKLINPSLEETFRHNINYFSDLESFVKTQITNYKENLFETYNGKVRISIEKLRSIKNLEFVLTELLLPYGFNLTSIKNLIDCLDKEPGKVFSSANYELNLDREYIFLKPLTSNRSSETEINLGQETVIFDNKEIHISQKTNFNISFPESKKIVFIDSDKLIFPLKLRVWRQGDKFIPLGMKGQKKISDFLINQKTPLSDKSDVFVLINGDHKIIWVLGLRLDDRFKITEETKKLTTFEFKVSLT